VLQPQNYRDRKDVLERGIDVVRRLWRGDAVERPAPDGRTVSVRTLPRPLQPELPVWITSAGNVETWQLAGRLGANVLTHLLGQSLEELRARVDAYRAARRAAGHAGDGHVTLMLHTFVGTSDEEVYRVVRQPMLDYLRSSLSLARSFVGSFPTFRTRAAGEDAALAADVAALAPAELDALLEHSFHRYHDRSGLFGTVGTCLRMVDRCREVGVDEIACLVDFGVPAAAVVDQFRELAELHRRARTHDVVAAEPAVPAAIVQHGITHLQCTPSMAAMLLQQDGGRDALRSLQCLLVGGEALPPPLARELRSLVPVVHNMYGPTETTIWSSSYAVAGDEDVVPIGTPLANTELLVLDRARRVVPRGVPGELYIGGRGVARGYLGRPELTAARFVDHPFRPAERLYRTGDLARHRRDGAFEFLGRLDTQVKVRGHRVELGEIEASLAGHPAVHECAVVVRPGAGGTEQLVAYLTARPAQAVEPAALRAWLAARLPEYMLPNRWVVLPELPRTPNLKIDRNALPAPAEPGAASAPAAAPAGATAAAAPAAGGAEPTGELEAAIAAIWCEVLAVRTVGPTQNFFDLGGHSLLAVQLQGRIRRTLGHAVALTDLFRFPTVRALAGHLAPDGAAAQASATAAQQQSRVHAEQRVQSLRDLRALRERARGRVSGDRTADA
jgi:natural product biosynthesis luciferase-like monooxygenase protein